MKKSITILFVFAVVFILSVQAHAALNLLGQGTSTHGTYNLIYDNDLDVTWYDYTSENAWWDDQMDWAGALSVTFGVNTYNDWRLPSTFDNSCEGINCINSEMGHLFFTELGNYPRAAYLGGSLQYTGDFQNLQSDVYWSSTEYAPGSSNAWTFETTTAWQTLLYKHNFPAGIAVRDGLAIVSPIGPPVVPEPISSTLFIIGGVALGFRRFRKRA